jgi:2,3-bisphosphoglycerate-independent phosphoglycerate mutase
MSAAAITDAVVASIQRDCKDFYLINYANADMVGHSGNFQATIKAVECLDKELERLFDVVVHQVGGTLIITADHGNAEQMIDATTGAPRTAHTNNPVPFFVISHDADIVEQLATTELPKTLTDIAPFILTLMGIPVPNEMKQ